MVYLKIDEYFKYIFNDIRQYVYDDESKPNYEEEKIGLDKLKSILQFVKNNQYYPSLSSKAAYLLLTLTTGHNFGNGNKRLALFTYIYFLHRNKKIIRPRHKNTYRKWFRQYFPNYTLSKHDFIRNIGWALYNLNLCINIKKDERPDGHNYNYDELKDIVENFTELFYK